MAKKERKVVVEFVKGYGLYNAGERAAFAQDRAAALIKHGVAEEPGVLKKARAAAAKALAATKGKDVEPGVGSRVSFNVEGLGSTEGEIAEVRAEGRFVVKVGTGDDADLYEVERSELAVLE
jgi:hypothetical protein